MNESITNRDGSRVVTVDNGDGTGTRTSYNSNGTETSTETLTGLAVPVDAVSPDAAIITLVQTLADPDATLDDLKLVAADLVTALPDVAP